MNTRIFQIGLVVAACTLSGIAGAQSFRLGKDAIPGVAPAGAEANAGGAGATEASDKDVTINSVGKSVALTCHGGRASIGGTGNTVQLSGDCTAILVTGTNNNVTADTPVCKGSIVNVAGTKNDVKLLGLCASVTIQGTSNSVTGMQAGLVNVSGTGNSVGWRESLGKQPKVTADGTSNKVYQLR
jgi:hypothetical protein